jgi:hypothetical protein
MRQTAFLPQKALFALGVLGINLLLRLVFENQARKRIALEASVLRTLCDVRRIVGESQGSQPCYENRRLSCCKQMKVVPRFSLLIVKRSFMTS